MGKLTVGQAKKMGVVFVGGDKRTRSGAKGVSILSAVNAFAINQPECKNEKVMSSLIDSFAWRKHTSSEMPCDRDLPVVVKFRNGDIEKFQHASCGGKCWSNYGIIHDIVKWKPDLKGLIRTNDKQDKLTAPEETPEEKEAVEWSGEGLPPVGCKVVYAPNGNYIRSELTTNWVVGEELIVIGHGKSSSGNDTLAVKRIIDDGLGVILSKFVFRLQTEAEKAEKEREEAAYDLYCDWCKHCSLPKFSFDRFMSTKMDKVAWLEVVDKTNYCKQ